MTIRIGEIELANAVAVAPMSGVSDLPFRRAALRAGAGLVVSEMVASEALAQARPDVVRRATGDKDDGLFVIQLAGREAKWMARGAELAEAAGADVIDINMGCPSRQVTGALSGSALMRDPDHALSLIEAVIGATSRPVTLKMRLGWSEELLTAPEIAARAEQAGVALFTVHGRTRNQFYKGVADWRAVNATKKTVSAPVLVNGDIATVDGARHALSQSGCDGVMIGRASIGRPWLAGWLADALACDKPVRLPSAAERCAIAIQQYVETHDHYGERLGVRMARKHLAGFIEDALAPWPEDIAAERRRICESSDPGFVIDALREAFSRSEKLAA